MVKKTTLIIFCLLFTNCVTLVFNVISYMQMTRLLQECRGLYEDLLEALNIRPPPVSKSEAIDIVLEYEGWNDTTLKADVTATLNYVLWHNTSCVGNSRVVLHQVTTNVSDYSPFEIFASTDHYSRITLRYVWIVKIGEWRPLCYFVDASTGEIVDMPPP